METRITVPISKIDEERRLVGGWAYVAKTADGAQVTDNSGDFVDDESWSDLKDAFIAYGLESRAGDDMHATFGVSKLAEMFVSDQERWEQMGVPEGTLPKGVFVTYRVDESVEGEAAWQAIKKGERKSLSIVGKGHRA